MEDKFYHDFKEYKRLGLKLEAKKALASFIDSFQSFEEKTEWTLEHLQRFKISDESKIRHEIYEFVVFPVLYFGFQKNDPKALYWLALTIHNLANSASLHNKIDWMGGVELLSKAYALTPDSDDIKVALLARLLAVFRYCDHEWPAGLVNDIEVEDCIILLKQIHLARKLDEDKLHAQRLDQFRSRVTEYMKRLIAFNTLQ